MRVEEVSIEQEDRGFELHVLTTDEGRFIFNIHGVAVDLYNEVVKNIGPWISEGLEARREYESGISGDPLLQGVLDEIKGATSEDDLNLTEGMRVGIDLARKAAKENR